MSRLQKWESSTRWPLLAMAAIFFVAFAIPIIWPEIDGWPRALARTTQTVVWVAFLIDYVTRLVLAPHKWDFFRLNILDLIAVAYPPLRPLGLLVLFQREAGERLRGHVALYVTFATATVVAVSTLSVLRAERSSPDANITGVGDALWWSLVTVFTVGYGDFYPVTTEGRLLAAILMLCGIALFGAVTAGLSSWLIERVSDADESERTAKLADIQDVHHELRLLREELAQLRAHRAADGASTKPET